MTKTQSGKTAGKSANNTYSNDASRANTGSVTGNAARSSASGRQHKTLNDLLKDGLKDIYSAEKQLVEALPEMARACNSEDLQEAFEKHLQQTRRHVERIEKVFERLGIEPTGEENCEAMEGLIREGREIIERYEMSPVRDSALIIAAQKVEHYEIATYGSLCELCDVLGYPKLSDLLGRSLDEEETTDKELSELAQDVNDEAHEMSIQEEEEMYGE